eukprot:m.249680 g.249680  ORF g.249680 m.249680 type:complete len:2437 (+) comp33877_c0_seq3:106-7416(+)
MATFDSRGSVSQPRDPRKSSFFGRRNTTATIDDAAVAANVQYSRGRGGKLNSKEDNTATLLGAIPDLPPLVLPIESPSIAFPSDASDRIRPGSNPGALQLSSSYSVGDLRTAFNGLGPVARVSRKNPLERTPSISRDRFKTRGSVFNGARPSSSNGTSSYSTGRPSSGNGRPSAVAPLFQYPLSPLQEEPRHSASDIVDFRQSLTTSHTSHPGSAFEFHPEELHRKFVSKMVDEETKVTISQEQKTELLRQYKAVVQTNRVKRKWLRFKTLAVEWASRSNPGHRPMLLKQIEWRDSHIPVKTSKSATLSSLVTGANAQFHPLVGEKHPVLCIRMMTHRIKRATLFDGDRLRDVLHPMLSVLYIVTGRDGKSVRSDVITCRWVYVRYNALTGEEVPGTRTVLNAHEEKMVPTNDFNSSNFSPCGTMVALTSAPMPSHVKGKSKSSVFRGRSNRSSYSVADELERPHSLKKGGRVSCFNSVRHRDEFFAKISTIHSGNVVSIYDCNSGTNLGNLHDKIDGAQVRVLRWTPDASCLAVGTSAIKHKGSKHSWLKFFFVRNIYQTDQSEFDSLSVQEKTELIEGLDCDNEVKVVRNCAAKNYSIPTYHTSDILDIAFTPTPSSLKGMRKFATGGKDHKIFVYGYTVNTKTGWIDDIQVLMTNSDEAHRIYSISWKQPSVRCSFCKAEVLAESVIRCACCLRVCYCNLTCQRRGHHDSKHCKKELLPRFASSFYVKETSVEFVAGLDDATVRHYNIGAEDSISMNEFVRLHVHCECEQAAITTHNSVCSTIPGTSGGDTDDRTRGEDEDNDEDNGTVEEMSIWQIDSATNIVRSGIPVTSQKQIDNHTTMIDFVLLPITKNTCVNNSWESGTNSSINNVFDELHTRDDVDRVMLEARKNDIVVIRSRDGRYMKPNAALQLHCVDSQDALTTPLEFLLDSLFYVIPHPEQKNVFSFVAVTKRGYYISRPDFHSVDANKRWVLTPLILETIQDNPSSCRHFKSSKKMWRPTAEKATPLLPFNLHLRMNTTPAPTSPHLHHAEIKTVQVFGAPCKAFSFTEISTSTAISRGDKSYVRAVKFTANGRRVLCGTKSGVLAVIDSESGQYIGEYKFKNARYDHIETSDNMMNSQLVIAGIDESKDGHRFPKTFASFSLLNIFNSASSSTVTSCANVTTHRSSSGKGVVAVSALAFSNCGSFIAVGSASGCVNVYLITSLGRQNTNSYRLSTDPLKSEITQLVFSPNDLFLLVADGSSVHITRFDPSSKQQRHVKFDEFYLVNEGGSIESLKFSPTWIDQAQTKCWLLVGVSGGDANPVILVEYVRQYRFDTKTNIEHEITPITGAEEFIQLDVDQSLVCSTFDPDGKYVVYGTNGGGVYRFDVGPKTTKWGVCFHEKEVVSLAHTPTSITESGKAFVASGGRDKMIIIYQPNTGAIIRKIEKGHDGHVTGLLFLGCGDLVSSADMENELRVFRSDTDFNDSFECSRVYPIVEGTATVKCLARAPFGKQHERNGLIVAGISNGSLRFVDMSMHGCQPTAEEAEALIAFETTHKSAHASSVIRRGNLELIKGLVKLYPYIVVTPNHTGNTLLHYAVRHHNTKLLSALLEANLSSFWLPVNDDGEDPLYVASNNRNIVKIILDHALLMNASGKLASVFPVIGGRLLNNLKRLVQRHPELIADFLSNYGVSKGQLGLGGEKPVPTPYQFQAGGLTGPHHYAFDGEGLGLGHNEQTVPLSVWQKKLSRLDYSYVHHEVAEHAQAAHWNDGPDSWSVEQYRMYLQDPRTQVKRMFSSNSSKVKKFTMTTSELENEWNRLSKNEQERIKSDIAVKKLPLFFKNYQKYRARISGNSENLGFLADIWRGLVKTEREDILSQMDGSHTSREELVTLTPYKLDIPFVASGLLTKKADEGDVRFELKDTLLHTFVAVGHPQLFGNQFMVTILEYKWAEYARFKYRIHFLKFLLGLVSYSMLCFIDFEHHTLIGQNKHSGRREAIWRIKNPSSNDHVLQAMFTVLFCFTLTLTMMDAQRLKKLGYFPYPVGQNSMFALRTTPITVYLTLLFLTLSFCTALFDKDAVPNDQNYRGLLRARNIFGSIGAFLKFMECIDLMRPLKNFGQLIRIVFKVISRSFHYFVLLGIMIMGTFVSFAILMQDFECEVNSTISASDDFETIFTNYHSDDIECSAAPFRGRGLRSYPNEKSFLGNVDPHISSSAVSYLRQIVETFNIMLVGDTELFYGQTSLFEDPMYSLVVQIVFITIFMFINIVMLNLMINLFDTYMTEIQEEEGDTFWFERASFIRDIEIADMSKSDLANEKYFPKWLHTLSSQLVNVTPEKEWNDVSLHVQESGKQLQSMMKKDLGQVAMTISNETKDIQNSIAMMGAQLKAHTTPAVENYSDESQQLQRQQIQKSILEQGKQIENLTRLVAEQSAVMRVKHDKLDMELSLLRQHLNY